MSSKQIRVQNIDYDFISEQSDKKGLTIPKYVKFLLEDYKRLKHQENKKKVEHY